MSLETGGGERRAAVDDILDVDGIGHASPAVSVTRGVSTPTGP